MGDQKSSLEAELSAQVSEKQLRHLLFIMVIIYTCSKLLELTLHVAFNCSKRKCNFHSTYTTTLYMKDMCKV
jgi:hypothetical protein